MRIFLDRFSFMPFLVLVAFPLSVPLAKAMAADDLNPLVEDEQSSVISVKANIKHKPQKPPTIVEENRPAILCSCDGGGIKGLFSAKLLELIDQAIKARIQIPLTDLVDMYAGTSTGGLIALALTTGHTPSEVVDLYLKQGPSIFSSSYYQSVTSLWGWWGTRYDPTNLIQVLNSAVGDASLQHAKKDVFVTTFVPDQNRILLLHRGTPLSMKEAAQATTAAPTYFPPVILNIPQKSPPSPENPAKLDKEFKCVDGGVGPNNPADLGVSMLHKHFPDRPPFVISIGTGQPTLQTSSGGVFSFLPQAFDTLSNASSAATDESLRIYLPKGNYFRFQFDTDMTLDATSSASLAALVAQAESFTTTPEFNELIDRLVEISQMKSSQ